MDRAYPDPKQTQFDTTKKAQWHLLPVVDEAAPPEVVEDLVIAAEGEGAVVDAVEVLVTAVDVVEAVEVRAELQEVGELAVVGGEEQVAQGAERKCMLSFKSWYSSSFSELALHQNTSLLWSFFSMELFQVTFPACRVSK